MIRNYNGVVNHSTLRDLKRLCDVNAENFKNLSEAYAQDSEVSFYTNLDPIIGCPDEMSKLVTLKSEAEITDYLKKDFIERLEGYLGFRHPDKDYLLDELIGFFKENGGKYPSKDEMRKLEITAENKRVTELPADAVTAETPNTVQELLKETLELAEEIMEARRETKPDDILIHVEPYCDELGLSNDDFCATISWNRHYGVGNNSDYSLHVRMLDDEVVQTISIHQYGGKADVHAENWYQDSIDEKALTDCFVTIHKGMVEFAEEEGIEFLSEIDYSKISA